MRMASSRSRKPCSPSSAKIERIERPLCASSSASASTQSHPSASASSWATVLLPVPREPIRKIRLASPASTWSRLLLAQGHRRQGSLDDLGHQFDGRLLRGKQAELLRCLADEEVDAGQDKAAAVPRLLDQQRLLGRVY